MVKAVAVLAGSDVKGTIFFSQEGDGNSLHVLTYENMYVLYFCIRPTQLVGWLLILVHA